MINDINPPAIVRAMHDEKTAREWHEQGLAAEIKRSAGTLEQAESWYYLKEGAGYQELGYQSIAEYVFKEFGKSAATCDKYIQIYRVMCVDLKKDMTELATIGAGKLSKVVGHVDENNVETIIDELHKFLLTEDVSHGINHGEKLLDLGYFFRLELQPEKLFWLIILHWKKRHMTWIWGHRRLSIRKKQTSFSPLLLVS